MTHGDEHEEWLLIIIAAGMLGYFLLKNRMATSAIDNANISSI